ncbi:MAG: integrase/recombinase XerD [Janthinobacterium sp.]
MIDMAIIPPLWNSDPLGQFNLFVRSPAFSATSLRASDRAAIKPMSQESVEIYTLMFGKFARWMQSEHKTLSTIDHRDLRTFIDLGEDGKPDLNSKIAHRYLRLLQRCYTHLSVSENPAQQALFEASRERIAKDQAMVVLSDEQLARFLAALPAELAKYQQNQPSKGWKRRRDRAMQLTMLCAGLRVSEVVGLLIEELGAQPDLDGALQLSITPEQKHNTSYEHATPLHRTAVPDVLAWLHERIAMGIPGKLLFPANPAGERLDKATVYRQVRATFVRAGISIARSGGRTLRNTFAVQELKNGTTDDELTEHLGLALESSTKTYVIAGLKIK